LIIWLAAPRITLTIQTTPGNGAHVPISLSRRMRLAHLFAAATLVSSFLLIIGVQLSAQFQSPALGLPSTYEFTVQHNMPRHVPTNKSGLYYLKIVKVPLPHHNSTYDRPWCKIGFQTNLAGSFYRDSHGEHYFEPHGCRLRRYTAAQARGILLGRTVVFYGDSLTRYHVFNLGVFIARGQLMERYAGVPDTAPSLNHQAQFRNPSYATDTNDTRTLMLRWFVKSITTTSSCMNSSHHCLDDVNKCYARRLDVRTPNGKFNLDTYPLYGATNASRDLETLRALMHSGADAIILNHGAWGGENMTAYWSHVLCHAKQEQLNINGGKTELIWRTTYHDNPPSRKLTEMEGNLTAAARGCGWNVLNLRELTGAALAANLPAHWDHVHLLPFMKDQITDVLLNLFASLWGINDVVEVCPHHILNSTLPST
jgi:hypothetical protein